MVESHADASTTSPPVTRRIPAASRLSASAVQRGLTRRPEGLAERRVSGAHQDEIPVQGAVRQRTGRVDRGPVAVVRPRRESAVDVTRSFSLEAGTKWRAGVAGVQDAAAAGVDGEHAEVHLVQGWRVEDRGDGVDRRPHASAAPRASHSPRRHGGDGDDGKAPQGASRLPPRPAAGEEPCLHEGESSSRPTSVGGLPISRFMARDSAVAVEYPRRNAVSSTVRPSRPR